MMKQRLAEVKLSDIERAKFNPKAWREDPKKIKALQDSIEEIGLISPVSLCQESNGKYALGDGHRRLAAYRALQSKHGSEYDEIPAIVMPRGTSPEDVYLAQFTSRKPAGAELGFVFAKTWKSGDIPLTRTTQSKLAWLKEMLDYTDQPATPYTKSTFYEWAIVEGISPSLVDFIRNGVRLYDDTPLSKGPGYKSNTEYDWEPETVRKVAELIKNHQLQHQISMLVRQLKYGVVRMRKRGSTYQDYVDKKIVPVSPKSFFIEVTL